MAEGGNHQSPGSSTTNWTEKIEESMRRDSEENQAFLKIHDGPTRENGRDKQRET